MGSGASIQINSNLQEITNIISKLDLSLPSQLQENKKRVVIGRIISENEPLISPLSFRRCVMYQLYIEVFDNNNNSILLFTEKNSINFFLTDSTSLIYIPIQAYDDIFISKDIERLPPLDSSSYSLYRDLFIKHGHTIDQYPSFRISEEVYEIGEQLAILGRPEFTFINSQKVLELRPTNKEQYDQKWYTKHNFTDQEMHNWEAFLTHGKLVCSDDTLFFRGVTVPFTSPQYHPGPIIPNYNYEKMGLLLPKPVILQQQQPQPHQPMMGGYPPQQQPQQQQGYQQQQPMMGGGYPQQQQGYPPQQQGYPQYQQQQQQPMMGGGYPNQQMGGYPPQQQGYPPQQGYQQQGYPPQQQGYPQQQQQPMMGGYPQMGGYPPQQQQQMMMSGYPNQQQQMMMGGGGYPPQQPIVNYQQQSGYPNQQQQFQQQQQYHQQMSGGYPQQQQQQQHQQYHDHQSDGVNVVLQNSIDDREERRRRRRERRDRGEQTSDTSDSDDNCSDGSGSSHGAYYDLSSSITLLLIIFIIFKMISH